MSLEMLYTPFAWVGVVVCTFVCIVSYLIFAYSIKEKSFEEVIEEQRKQSLLDEELSRQEKTKKEKERKHKKWGKRSKEKSEQFELTKVNEPSTVNQDTQASPELIQEIKIIEPKEISTKKKVKGKQPVNTPAPLSVTDQATQKPITEITVQIMKPIKKEKALENLPRKVEETGELKPDKHTVESVKQSKRSEEEKSLSQIISSPPPAIHIVPTPSLVSSKKKKKEHVVDKVDVAHMTVQQLISIIKDTAFDDVENQMVIDALLNKHKEASSWKVKDSHATLKKHLVEKENALEQEQKQNHVFAMKLKEEFHQEQSKAIALQEKIVSQQHEIQALNLRLQSQEQLAHQKGVAEEKANKLEKSLEAKMEILKKLETESRVDGKSKELDVLKKSRDDLQKVHNLLVEQHTQHISSHKEEVKILNAKLADMEKSLQKANDINSQLTKDINAVNQKCENLEHNKTSVEQLKAADNATRAELEKLQILFEESKAKHRELDTELQKAVCNADGLAKKNAELLSEIGKLQSENEHLSAELAKTNERVAGDGQEMAHQNGDINGKVKVQDQSCDQAAILQEKELVLTQLYEDLNVYKSKISNLSEEVELHKQKNNELREKNWKAMDALAAAERISEQKIADAEEKVNLLQSDLENLRLSQKNSSISSSQELSDQHSQLQKSLQELQLESSSRLQELQLQEETNRRISADLKQVQDAKIELEHQLAKSFNSEKELMHRISELEINLKSSMQRLFPTVSMEDTLPHEEWLVEFEKQAINVLKAASCSREELLVRLSKEEEEKCCLIAKFSHYEKVLAETEASLNCLQDSAKKQESFWEEKFSNKEAEFQKVSKELESHATERESLNSTIQQMGRLEELQEQLRLLQSTLQESESEKSQLELRYSEVDKNYISLRDKVESKDKTIQELQNELASFNHVTKELEDVKIKLEKEKKINKDFSSQMVRLNSLVKIGQDALNAEQENVKKLQSQLSEAQITSNGTSSPASTEESEDASGKK